MNSKLVKEIRTQLVDVAPLLRAQLRHRPLPLKLFLALCFNLVIAPAVLAASGGTVTRLNAYAIGILGLVTLGLAIYLFAVMMQPQRF